ncbi:MAG: CAP domain-containing protein [Candidatus Doudnabacteria bacterium]|nr:CAP domain-containing protein [Candidatus Doudnabacteria bacterium]
MKLKSYLIAGPENHYQPWILSKTAMACFVLSIWTLRMFLPNYIAVSAPGIDAQDLMHKVNAERISRYLPALITNSKLNSAASIKSNDMLVRGYFDHVNPDGDYVWPVIESQGYKPYQSLGENLAMDFTSADAVVNAWMNSPGHRANILNEKFEDQGMAAVFGEFEPNHNAYLVTNLFGTLLKRVASSNITQPSPTPSPTPTPLPTPTQSPKQTAQVPTPVPPPTNQPTPSQQMPSLESGNEVENLSTNLITTNAGNPAPLSSGDQASLVSLKILVSIFAAIYTILLVIDSIIIHRNKILRENISASHHALLLALVSLTNFITLWL